MQIATTPGGDDDNRKKAQAFFDRGKTIAQTENFEYAVDIYIQGLSFDPDNVDAHKALREVGFRRTAMGGKPMGMFDKMKQPKPTDEKTKMLAAERLLAYEPGNTNYMIAMHEAAQAGGFSQTEAWIEKLMRAASGR